MLTSRVARRSVVLALEALPALETLQNSEESVVVGLYLPDQALLAYQRTAVEQKFVQEVAVESDTAAVLVVSVELVVVVAEK